MVTHNTTTATLTPHPSFLSSALLPSLRVPDLEDTLLLVPDRWIPEVANIVLASNAPISAVVAVLVTLAQVYAMQEIEMKQRELNREIEELNKVLEEERGKVGMKMD